MIDQQVFRDEERETTTDRTFPSATSRTRFYESYTLTLRPDRRTKISVSHCFKYESLDQCISISFSFTILFTVDLDSLLSYSTIFHTSQCIMYLLSYTHTLSLPPPSPPTRPSPPLSLPPLHPPSIMYMYMHVHTQPVDNHGHG